MRQCEGESGSAIVHIPLTLLVIITHGLPDNLQFLMIQTAMLSWAAQKTPSDGFTGGYYVRHMFACSRSPSVAPPAASASLFYETLFRFNRRLMWFQEQLCGARILLPYDRGSPRGRYSDIFTKFMLFRVQTTRISQRHRRVRPRHHREGSQTHASIAPRFHVPQGRLGESIPILRCSHNERRFPRAQPSSKTIASASSSIRTL